MEIRKVQYFVKVAALGSFSAAAKALYVSQSTISQQIKELEDELGVELLERSTRQVALSDYGEAFLPLAQKLLSDEQNCRERIADISGLDAGELRIGSTYTFFPVLVETIREFTRQHPKIFLGIKIASVEELMEMLEKGEIDFALSFKSGKKFPNLTSEQLFRTELCIAVNRNHPLASREAITLHELSHFPLALSVKGMQTRDKFEDLIKGTDLDFDIRSETNDTGLLLALVRNIEIATVISKNTIPDSMGLHLLRIDEADTQMIGCYHTRSGSYNRLASREFLKELAQNNTLDNIAKAQAEK